ncbi:MAG: Helicase associated domain protein, partial [Verrucomicrobiota bacterium]
DSPHFHSRILFTNCDEFASVLNDRQGFFCIRGSDLDRLEADDFKAIEAWLADSVYQAPRKTPLPHQTEALEKILPAFKEHDRISAIMACGTGKTLVALWVAEHIANAGGASVPASRDSQPQGSAHEDTRPTSPDCKILVLLPSLALLRQTLHEWLRETNIPSLAYLCVCSDATVKEGLDALTTAQSDLDFEVSTNPTSVRAFLDASFAGTKIIFSTYQSARVVGDAMKAGETFDLGIFDEAHKTAGREGRNFAFALEDKNLAIRKRLFVTATPRHYNPLNKNKDGDAQLVFSMDKREPYGLQAYRLPFGEAAKRNIICRYKVVISVITSQQVTNELLSRGEVLVNGDAIRARQVANQIALVDAIAKYGVNKVFTFHSTVASAASFTSRGNEGVVTHLPEFKTLHVNGTMPTVSRERVMREFRECKRGIISNARCLTEGVDVPAVDMVAFLAPRRSRVDIVQATGRAMRLDPPNNKNNGYILVPLYLEQATDETVEQAVLRSDFSEVWDVLQSLQERDEVLAKIIREKREERGQTKGFDDSRFRERVEIVGPEINFEFLRQSITTECLTKIGEQWFEMFGSLKAFNEQHGHCNVPDITRHDQKLSNWVVTQRQFRRRDTLAPTKVALLDSIGFNWDFREAEWERMYSVLKAFKVEHGHCRVPDRWKPRRALDVWVGQQRSSRKSGRLSSDKIRRLDELQFEWTPFDTAWDETYLRLVSYHAKHGDCQVPFGWPEDQELSRWVVKQRSNHVALSGERRRKLEALGFVWDCQDAAWDEMFNAQNNLKRKMADHERFSVDFPNARKLAKWAVVQRTARNTGQLAPDRIRRLNEIGFVWDVRGFLWNETYEALVAFRAFFGNCSVPRGYKKNPKLFGWLGTQRTARKKGILSPMQIQKLDELGFPWSPQTDKWEIMFAAFQRFKSQHDHSNVLSTRGEQPGLAMWISQQRRDRRTGVLNAERFQRLDAIGFSWSPTAMEDGWREMFKALRKFKAQHGHCNVPHLSATDPKLASWVATQRRLRRSGMLQTDKALELDQLGLCWNPHQTAWEEMFAALVTYHRTNGDCNVPRNWQKNPRLANWVNKQRRERKLGKLDSDRQRRLDGIKFDWEPFVATPLAK